MLNALFVITFDIMFMQFVFNAFVKFLFPDQFYNEFGVTVYESINTLKMHRLIENHAHVRGVTS